MIGMRGVAVAVVGLGIVLPGCGPKNQPTMEPTVEQQGDAVPTVLTEERRSEQLGDAIDQFAAARRGLQGHSDAESRRQLAGAFQKLEDVLTLLKGSSPDGAFRQQVRIIERARNQLTGDSATAPEPTVNAAIRAAQSALTDMVSNQYADDERVKEALVALAPRVDELSRVRGPIHGFETARALDAIGTVTERMADAQQQRTPAAPAATAPAASPS